MESRHNQQQAHEANGGADQLRPHTGAAETSGGLAGDTIQIGAELLVVGRGQHGAGAV